MNGKLSVGLGRTVCRDKISNYAPVWTISQNITAVPWKLKVPTQFQIWSVSTIQKHWEEVKKCILHGFQDLKALFLLICTGDVMLSATTITLMNKVISHIHYLCIASPLLKKRFGYNFFKKFLFQFITILSNSRPNISYTIIFTFNMFHNQIVFLQH